MKNATTKKHGALIILIMLMLLIHVPFGFAKSLPENRIDLNSVLKDSSDFPLPVESNNMAVIYDSLQLDTLGLSRQAFIEAYKGYNYLKEKGKLDNEGVLSIVDFSLPSNEKRLFVIDLENGKVLFNTYVAHGKNSGGEYARYFSIALKSHKSSLGFYITGNTYFGEHGLSLRLDGEEKGINDNAARRAIVIHSADYVGEKRINTTGYMGRSYGCPAVPPKYAEPIIETIKEGSCLFIYSPNPLYKSKSKLLQQTL